MAKFIIRNSSIRNSQFGIMYTLDDLQLCSEDCTSCAWAGAIEDVCTGKCVGDDAVCPWLLVCRCINPKGLPSRAAYLERLVAELPPSVAAAPVEVPLAKVRLAACDVRLRRDPEAVKELARSIARDGLFSPPVCVAAEDGYLDVIMGRTRVMAVRQLGWEKVPCRVLHRRVGDGEMHLLALKENTLRREMDADEEAYWVYLMWKETGASVRALARRIGKSKSWVAERLKLGRMLYGGEGRDDPESLPVERRTYPSRLTFYEDDVRQWLEALRSVGVEVSLDGRSVREAWLEAMEKLRMMRMRNEE